MVYAALDIHKAVFQAATLDVETGQLAEQRFPATPEALAAWAEQCPPGLAAHPRGLGLQPRTAADGRRTALGRRAPPRPAGARPDRSDAGHHARATRTARPGRCRATPLRQDRPTDQGALPPLRDRPDHR